MSKKAFFLFSLILCLEAKSQMIDEGVCKCCSMSMLQFRNEFIDLFPPAFIKKNKFASATLLIISKQQSQTKNTDYDKVDNAYRELIFKFDEDGYVTSQRNFYLKGKQHSILIFERDLYHQIKTKSIYSVDSNGNYQATGLMEKWNYFYKNGRLVKLKKCGEGNIELADSMSDYISYQFNDHGRLEEQIEQFLLSPQQVLFFKTTTTYQEKDNSSISVTKDRTKLVSIINTKYGINNLPYHEITYDTTNKKKQFEQMTAYNDFGQINQIKKISEIGDMECPEEGTFEDNYQYGGNKLLSKIFHIFKNVKCELTFEYMGKESKR